MSFTTFLFWFSVWEIAIGVLSLVYRSIDQSLPPNPYRDAASFVSNRALSLVLWAALAYHFFHQLP